MGNDWSSGGSDCLAFVIGFLSGFIGGFIPGLHSNTIISILASMGLDERITAILIISLFPAHMISSFVPSIFFGIPESSTVVTVLPGQRMVLRGEGLTALKTVLLSCIIAALASASLFYLSLSTFPLAYNAIRQYMKYILLGVVVFLLARSKKPHFAVLIFVLSGLLGYFALDRNNGLSDPFLPLFSGMFAMAAILNYTKGAIPKQKDKSIERSDYFSFAKFSLLGVLLGMVADLLPAIGSPSQVATFATIFMPFDTLGYLATISAISVSQAIFSLSTSASIGKSRVGATAWLSEFMDIDKNLLLLISLFILSMAIAVLLVHWMRGHVAKLASIDFSAINLVLAAYLMSITFIIDGTLGVVILLVASALGWLTLKLGVERTNLMGSIIIPTLLLLFRIFL